MAIGLVLETATLTGVDLFNLEATTLAPQVERTDDKLTGFGVRNPPARRASEDRCGSRERSRTQPASRQRAECRATVESKARCVEAAQASAKMDRSCRVSCPIETPSSAKLINKLLMGPEPSSAIQPIAANITF